MSRKLIKKPIKFLFVSGGVISGLGKGITASSLALLLKSAGYKVSITKTDMYLNLDAGTMNPLEHGEVFVTDDGMETDQDLGHYERFLNQDLSRDSYFTMGQVYWEVLQKERRLEYNGKCVEGHVHVPEEIIRRWKKAGDNHDIVIVEIGGTVGEFQNMMCFEALRRLKQQQPENVSLVHVVYLPIPSFLGEMKSKPAQSSVYDLYRLGLQPDFLVCRADTHVDTKRRQTIAFNTGIKLDHIFTNPDVDSIYEIPLIFDQQKAKQKILNQLGLPPKKRNLTAWKNFVKSIKTAKKPVNIAILGKYFNSGAFQLQDSYVCVIEAIKHASWSQGFQAKIQWFDVTRFEDKSEKKLIEKELANFDGIIVPQGWGSRGVEGKLEAVKFARENKIPYLGLCFGMQMAVIEFARNVCGLKDANTQEADPSTPHPVIHVMPRQKKYLKEKKYGGTIRLGSWPCKIFPKTLLHDAYNSNFVQERHRHRYEFNNEYRELLEKAGLIISGTSPDGKLVESIELPKNIHPFFVATQFHPEYKSRPLSPHPIFSSFIKASAKSRLKST